MKRVVLFLLVSCRTAAALDFTPREVKATGEGGEYRYLRFVDGAKTVSYMPPQYWTYHGGGPSFRLAAPGVIGAEVGMAIFPLDASLPVAEENLPSFEQLTRDSLPKGAEKIEALATVFNPCELDGKKTIEVTATYVIFGQMWKVSRLYLSREKELLRFSVVARPAEFNELRKTFHASLHTLAGF